MSRLSPRKKVAIFFIIVLLIFTFCSTIILTSNWLQDNDSDQNQDDEDLITPNDLHENIPNYNDDNSDSENPILNPDDSEITLEIVVDDYDVRTREEVNFTVKNAPNGSNITWDMGDGTITYGEKITHSYGISSYYMINVTAIWDDKFAKTSIELGVKNRDGFVIYRGTSKKVGIVGQLAVSIGTDMWKGISTPYVIVALKVYNFTGNADIGVSVTKENDIEYWNGEIRNESIEGRMEEYSISWEITSKELESYENFFEYYIKCWLEWTSSIGYVEYYVDISINY